jgi:hypothetical protein
MAGLTDYFDWDRKGVAILGKVDTGKVSLHFPLHHTLKYFKDTVSTAVSIATLLRPLLFSPVNLLR